MPKRNGDIRQGGFTPGPSTLASSRNTRINPARLAPGITNTCGNPLSPTPAWAIPARRHTRRARPEMRDFAAKGVRFTQQTKGPEIELGRGSWRLSAIRPESPERGGMARRRSDQKVKIQTGTHLATGRALARSGSGLWIGLVTSGEGEAHVAVGTASNLQTFQHRFK